MQPVAPVNYKIPTMLGTNATAASSSTQKRRRSNRSGTDKIQIIGTRDHVILQKGDKCLWCSKDSGSLKATTAFQQDLTSKPHIDGVTHGLIGKIRFFEDSDWYLLLIDEVRKVGALPPTEGVVYCIEKVSLLPLSLSKSSTELNIESYVLDKREKEMKEREKLERRLKEALLNMFNGSQSFYFSPEVDLTQSTQRQQDCGDSARLRQSERVDDRFFWNKHMIPDLLEQDSEADVWIIPVIQGFIQIKTIPIPSGEHMGVFKKHLEKRRALDMRSYTIVEQDGGQYISRSYSPHKDDPDHSPEQKQEEDTDSNSSPSKNEGERISPFRERSIVVSSPTREIGIKTQQETNDSDLSSSVITIQNSLSATPETVCLLPDVVTTSSPHDSNLHSSLISQTHTINTHSGNPLSTSEQTSQKQHSDILTDMDPLAPEYLKPQPQSDVSRSSNDSSPTKSVHRSNRDSWRSFDTDEWIDDQLEERVEREKKLSEEEEQKDKEENDAQEKVEREMKLLDLDEEEETGTQEEDNDQGKDPAEEENTWVRGLSGRVKWSPNGLPMITIALISRRSRHRAGTRYLRRGVDESGHVANYVETEMVVRIDTHLLSFMIVRGSVPVYWTQSGQKYRPDITIQRDEDETLNAFENHFEQQINLYQEQVIVSLVNQSGRERPVGEAYEKYLVKLDCPSLTYVAFDFHHHCKVNQWHNINLLLDKIEEYINRQHYFWYDSSSNDVLCYQKGVFRVNCVDCLDRTNVVQSVICREVLQTALQKLGLLSPFVSLSGEFLQHYQEIWANNGDTISKQYTGTAAMKGDLTRYGQRRLYGVMKDGYNSAHRFILSLFRDAYRQVIIDLQQGVAPSEALLSLPDTQKGLTGVIDDNGPVIKRRSLLSAPPAWSTDREEMIADIIRSCIEQLYPHNPTIPVRGWVLIEALGFSFVKGSTKEEETVLLLCSERGHICVANYNAEFEHISCCIRIPLERIERIAVGQIGTLLRSSPRLHMRIYYSLFPGVLCHFTFRTVYSLSPEEDKCILLSIAQAIVTSRPQIAVQEQRLSRKRSPAHEGIVYLIAPDEWMPGHMKDIATQRSSQSSTSPLVDAESSEESSQLGSNSNINYAPLGNSSKASTPKHTHSRHSSVASSQLGLINDDTLNQSGYESDSSNQEVEMSYSVPNSPSLPRRTSVLSLEERSQLLSHSSMSDLMVLSEEENPEETKTNVHHARKRSLAFSMEGSSESDSEDEAMHHRRMNVVLSTVRPNRMVKQKADSELPIDHHESAHGGLGDLMTEDELRHYGGKRNGNFKDANLSLSVAGSKDSPDLHSEKNHFLSDSAPAQPTVTQSNDDKSTVGSSSGAATGGWNFSKIKGKLLGKVRSVTSDYKWSSAESEDQGGSSSTGGNRTPKQHRSAHQQSSADASKSAMGRNSSGSKFYDNEIQSIDELPPQSNSEKELLDEAMKHSKTRFIII